MVGDFLTPGEGENLKTPKGGKAQKAQKSAANFENTYTGEGSKGSKGTFDTFDTSPPEGYSKIQAPLPVTTERIRAHRQKYHPANDRADVVENIEMHDSALFDLPIVEVDFYDGRRIRIPQASTPEGWEPPF